jgi:4-amino-4-deoxy-L-arabinose transferase-like glycosyltransferase
MKPRYALIPVTAGALFLLAATLFIIVSGGSTVKAGGLSISIHSLRAPVSIFWAFFMISAFILLAWEKKSPAESRKYEDREPLQRLELILLILLFIAGFAVRLYKITMPPLDFHPTRQYNNAIIARQLYCNTLKAPEDRWKHGFYNVDDLFLEPPVSEMTAVLAYRIAGCENLALPRIISSIFWLAGAAALYCALRRISGRTGAFFGAFLFLFMPFSIASSRCFMPDPLMVSALCFYILAIFRYIEKPSAGNLALSLVTAAIAVFLKGMSVFIVIGGAGMMLLYRALTERRWKEGVFTFALFLAMTSIPVSLYAALFLGGRFGGRLFGRFLPSLTFTLIPYAGWLNMLDIALGVVFVAMALLALATVRGAVRFALAGMLIGYAAFALVFNFHCATHDYYHMPLIPVVCVLAGAFIGRTVSLFEAYAGTRASAVITACMTGILLLAFVTEGAPRISAQECVSQISLAEEMGCAVNHSRNTILLAPYYGDLIKYYGWVEGSPWPDSRDLQYWEWEGEKLKDPRELLLRWIERRHVKYFIATDVKELEKQHELAEFMDSNYKALLKRDDAVIYDLSQSSQGLPSTMQK